MRWLLATLFAIVALFALGTATAGPFPNAPVMRSAGDEQPKPTQPIPAELVGSTARAGSITVIAEPGLEDVAKDLASKAAGALEDISADLIDGLPRPSSIEVHLVRDASDLPRVAPPGRSAPPWAIGVAYPDLNVISVAMRRGGNVVDPVNTLRHELAHLALGAALGERAPRWLHEGFAYQHSADASFERTETLAGMTWFGGVVPIEDLDRSFPAEESPAHRAYAQSYDFVGYLSRRGHWEDTEDDGDRWPFRRFLADIGHGKTLDQAARKEFGKSIHELFDEWKSNVTSRYLLAPIGVLGLAAWCFVALLLVLAWRRRRRLNRARMNLWDLEERRRDREEQKRKADLAARLAAIRLVPDDAPPVDPAAPPPSTVQSTSVVPPAFRSLTGDDPFDDEPTDEPLDPNRLLN